MQDFEDLWVKWWTAAQPEWRQAKGWPFSQREALGEWGTKLSSGGKDGIFLVVMSLGWWAHAPNRSMDSNLDAAIRDVAWVMGQLVTSLSARSVSRTSSPLPPAPPSQPRTDRGTSGKPPKKRSRVR
jgi:hypothetical protein